MVRKKSPKKKKRIGFKKVEFFSGFDTPDPLDDRKVSFIARNRGKKSPLPKPKRVRALEDFRSSFDPQPRKQKSRRGIPKGIAENTGISFDKSFGLGSPAPFKQKIGIDPAFGKKSFDTDFSKAFREGEFDFGDLDNAQETVDFGESTMISDDFEEPTEENILGKNEVPTLLDSIPKVTDAKELPLTDEEEERTREDKITEKFLRVRQEALETGGNPLTPEEDRNFQSSPRFTRNFGTTGRRAGASFGRF